MPKLVHCLPKYRRHKASGQAVVTINGQDHYLGRWKSAESKAEHKRLIGEYLAHGRVIQDLSEETTVSEVILAYLRWGDEYYAESNELEHVTLALRPVRELYGETPAAKFGPLALKVVRDRMIADGLTRSGINHRISRIKRVFRWGVENELIPPTVYQGLQAVRGLAHGRTKAKESEPVKPVPEAFVDAVEGHVLPPVWAMIELQRLTGMRPGEVVRIRTCDIDTSGNVWIYRPPKHKNAHRGHNRQVYIGPQAQSVLRPWLKTDLQAYLFSPREAMEWQRAERQRNRKTPLSCGNRPGTNRSRTPQKKPGEVYSVEAYRNAIEAACKAAGAPVWTPNQLRHNAGTRLRREYGLDVARVILGHRSPAVTEIYAEVDQLKAIEVMAKVG